MAELIAQYQEDADAEAYIREMVRHEAGLMLQWATTLYQEATRPWEAHEYTDEALQAAFEIRANPVIVAAAIEEGALLGLSKEDFEMLTDTWALGTCLDETVMSGHTDEQTYLD